MTMDKHDPGACDDENGNCNMCGHPFAPHLVLAYDGNDLSKGGELRCHVADCDCVRTLSFDLSDKEWAKKLNFLLKPPS
jgi:hypothetical protein